MKQGDGTQSDMAFEALLQALRSGRLRGGKFLAVPALVEMLSFPLAATREAVKRAEEQALLTVLPKRGVMIMETGPETTRACMDMRAVLEKEGVRRLIARGGDLPLAELRAAHEAVLQVAQSTEDAELSQRALATDLSLHDFMATGLDNPFLREAYEANRNRIAIIQNARVFLVDRAMSAMQEHLAIIDALERRDADRAVAEIERHLRLTLRWWGIT